MIVDLVGGPDGVCLKVALGFSADRGGGGSEGGGGGGLKDVLTPATWRWGDPSVSCKKIHFHTELENRFLMICFCTKVSQNKLLVYCLRNEKQAKLN